MPPSSTSLLRHAFACLAFCTAGEAARATEWVAQPSIWWYLDYDTNRRLAPAGTGEVPDSGFFMTLDLLLRRLTGTGELAIHPQVEFQRFTKDTALNSNNGSVELDASHHEQRWSVGSKLAYSDQSTLITEIASTGIVDASTRQESLTADVNAARQLTARQGLS